MPVPFWLCNTPHLPEIKLLNSYLFWKTGWLCVLWWHKDEELVFLLKCGNSFHPGFLGKHGYDHIQCSWSFLFWFLLLPNFNRTYREVERLEIRNPIKLGTCVGVKHPRITWPFKRNFAASANSHRKPLALIHYELSTLEKVLLGAGTP